MAAAKPNEFAAATTISLIKEQKNRLGKIPNLFFCYLLTPVIVAVTGNIAPLLSNSSLSMQTSLWLPASEFLLLTFP